MITLCLIITLFRFGQSIAIWWFMLTLFRRSFKEYTIRILLSSFFISLIILFYNLIKIPGAFLIFALEVPFFTLFHLLIIKKGLDLAILESVIGYYLYRITETDIAMIFDWAHIISIREAVTEAGPAILMQFVVPFIVIFIFQMLLVRKKWGYYLVQNRAMPNKWQWSVLMFNSGVILYYFKRLLHDIDVYHHYKGYDEQPYIIFFIALNMSILWYINKIGWESHYAKQSIASFYRKKSIPLNLRKVGKHP